MKKKKIIAADLFCGAGGTSTGLARACKCMGFDLDLVAVNHWDVAISTHSKNHPNAKHFNSAINDVDLKEAVPGGRLHLLVASPECTHFSNARGGKPMSDQKRATPLDILRWLKNIKVDNVLIENVREFQNWGPLGKDGRPIKERKGESFREFIDAIKALGYNVEWRVLNAADYGDPTTRQRLFIIARLGKKKIVWPEPTHSKTGTDGKKKWRAAREIIDWSLEGKSIFNRKKPLAASTLKRIEAGLRKFGGANAEPFIIMLRNHGGAISVDEPVKTISTSGSHHGLVEPKPFVIGQQSGSVARSIDDPLMTLSTAGAISLTEPFIINLSHMASEGNGDDPHSRRCYDANNPLPTVTGKCELSVVEPFLVQYYGQSEHSSIDAPAPTLTTKDRFGLAEPFLVPQFSQNPPKSVDDPLGTLTTTSRGVGLCEPFMVPFFSEGENQKPRTHSVDEPMPVVTANAPGLVEPIIMCIDHGSSNGNPRSVDDPLPVVTSKERLGVIEPYIVQFNNNSPQQSVEDPLPTVTTREKFGIVWVNGTCYGIDIRFRMLQPHEQQAAMSFPDDYEILGNREKKVKQIGNAVPGWTATRLTESILKQYAIAV